MVSIRALLAAATAAAFLGGCSAHRAAGGDSGSSAPSVARVGQPAPDWTEPSAPSGTVSLAALRGNVVYLNFFATWCPPCNEEAPAIDALQREFGPRGLRVVGIDVLESAGKAAQFRKEHALSYPAVVDDGTLRNQYNVNGLPVHVFIDRQGVVSKIVVGEMSAAEMRANVVRLLH